MCTAELRHCSKAILILCPVKSRNEPVWPRMCRKSSDGIAITEWRSLGVGLMHPSEQASSPFCVTFPKDLWLPKTQEEIRKGPVSKQNSSTDRIVCFWKPSLNTYPFHYLTRAQEAFTCPLFYPTLTQKLLGTCQGASARHWRVKRAVFATFQEGLPPYTW